MLSLIPLLLFDPSLPEATRLRLRGSAEDRRSALVELGLSCADAAELADAPPCAQA